MPTSSASWPRRSVGKLEGNGGAAVVLGTGQGGKALIVAACSPRLVERGVTAPLLLEHAAKQIGGGAGGKPILGSPEVRTPTPSRKPCRASRPGSPSSSATTSMSQTTRPGRVLGLDLGDARIGVAISDDDRRLAMPLGTVPTGAPGGPQGDRGPRRRSTTCPWSSSGSRGRCPERGDRRAPGRAFAGALADVLPVPVEMQDERLSTVEAERGLREAGVSGVDRRRVVDRSAAAVILQAWLDAHR